MVRALSSYRALINASHPHWLASLTQQRAVNFWEWAEEKWGTTINLYGKRRPMHLSKSDQVIRSLIQTQIKSAAIWKPKENSSFLGHWLCQTGLLPCLPRPFLLVSSPGLAFSSLKAWAQWVPDFSWSCEMTPWKQAGSECPHCPAQKLFRSLPVTAPGKGWSCAGTSFPRNQWLEWLLASLDWDCLSGRSSLVNAGYWVKSGQIETQELLSKMSWPVFYRRSSRWSVCPFWPLNLLIYFPFQEI